MELLAKNCIYTGSLSECTHFHCHKLFLHQVVVKFIKKNKVLSECWTEDQRGRRLPLEVSLLKMLKHPNIVKVWTAKNLNIQLSTMIGQC